MESRAELAVKLEINPYQKNLNLYRAVAGNAFEKRLRVMLLKSGFSQFNYCEGFKLTEIKVRDLVSRFYIRVAKALQHEFQSVQELAG